MNAHRAHAALLVLAFVGVFTACAGQREALEKYGLESKKSLKRLEEAKLAFRYKEFPRALDMAEDVLDREPNSSYVMQFTGYCAYEAGEMDAAERYLTRALDMDEDPQPNTLFYLGQLRFKQHKYAKSADYFQQYLNREPRGFGRISIAQEKIKRANFAAEAIKDPIEFEPENLGQAINSPGEDYMPVLTADGQMMFFTSRRPGVQGGFNQETRTFEEDFYIARKRDGQWQEAVNMGAPVNTTKSEGSATITPDGRFVYFTACRRDDGQGSCDLYEARYDGERGSEVRNMGPQINSPFWDSYPSVSGDGNVLFFSSARPGGKGKEDIWYSVKVDGRWQKPRNLPGPINTAGSESSPFIHADDQTLYFSSNGHMGFGEMDLFMSRLDTADSVWGEPENLGFPLNTPYDDRYIFINTAGTVGYINSDRMGGLGGIDIYRFDVDEAIRPRPATYVRGFVVDSITREAVPDARVQLVELASGDTVRSVNTSNLNGKFLLSLPLGHDYAAYTDAPGYLFHSKHFSLKELDRGQKYFDLSIPLSKLEKDEVVRLDNIFFAFDKANLRPASRVELQKLLTFLQQNPAIRIQLRGHTDNRGDDAYNQTLSQERAEAVKAYLVERGIDPGRLEAKGFGETRPIADNQTEAGRAQNRRTEFKVLSTGP